MRQASTKEPRDQAAANHRNARTIVSVPARYTLTNRFDSRGKRREFSCRIVGISPHEMVLSVPVRGALGERIITNCAEFGKLEGVIGVLFDGGFTLKILASNAERAKLTAKIDWYEQAQNRKVADGRSHKRIVPKNPLSTLILADGSYMGCFVIDMSVTGAAVSADLDPKIGTPLAVGKVVGQVVRRLPAGFAVKFIERQDPDYVEQLVIHS